MQNCPSCQLLMDDHEVVCPACAAQGAAGIGATVGAHPSAATGVAGPGAPAPGGAGVSATAVMERPAPPSTAAAPAVRYRQPGRGRRVAGWMVVLGVLVTAAVVLGAMAVRHQGPFADLAVDAGLIAPPLVDVPDRWALRESEAGRFEVVMPAGATPLDEPVDPAAPAAGGTFGFESSLGEGGSTAVVSTDMGQAANLAVMDDPVGFDALVDLVSSVVVQSSASGTETVRRPVQVANGRAVDVVVVDDTEAITTRARYVLAGGRLHAIITTGADEGAAALDEVHARVLDTFEITE